MNTHSTSAHAAHHSGDLAYTDHTTHALLAATKRISWGAVFAGTIIALVAQLLFSLLGLGIGMGTIDPQEETNPMEGLGIGSIIWWSVTMLISLFIGGWASGRLAGIPRSFDGTLHGVLSYCVFTLISFYLLTTAVGRIIGGVGNVIGKTVSLAGQGLGQVAPEIKDAVSSRLQEENIDLSNLKQEAQTLLAQTGKPELQPGALRQQSREAGRELRESAGESAENPQAAGQTLDQSIDQLFGQVKDVGQEVDKEAVVNVIVARTGKSQEEASQIADNWINTFNSAKAEFQQRKEEAKAKAEKAADDAASAASKAGIFGFIGLMLGAVVAGFGGRTGTPRDAVSTEGEIIRDTH